MEQVQGEFTETESMMDSEMEDEASGTNSDYGSEREGGEEGLLSNEDGDDEDKEVKMYHFRSRVVAFEFYNKYAMKKGFAARRWNTVKSKEGRVSQQTFVCFKQGYRLEKHLNKVNRNREARPITRCSCATFMRVRYARETSRWIVKAFSDEHSHQILPGKYEGMLTSHRKMNETEILQMNSMQDAGIGVTQIYGLAANQSGGFNNVGYRKRNMYNEIVKQRRGVASDARAAIAYL
ncbi:FAR1 DNA-binding domain [Sesbania bispinosa]|nr:FAR1 DNA-binding domain [Sesbania bispinosa]